MQQVVVVVVITPMILAILLEVVLEVSVEEEEEELTATVIRELEELVVSLMVLQQLLVEKLQVDKVDKIQEVVEEALGTTKQQVVEAQELFTLGIQPWKSHLLLNIYL
jgi:hypothetical protein